MTTYYAYRHHAGYGRDDHRADELIARAARHLGAQEATMYIAQAMGLAAHPVPMASASMRLPAARGVRTRMERALRAARTEVGRYIDTAISVECRRDHMEGTHDARTRVTERREGRRWIEIERQQV